MVGEKARRQSRLGKSRCKCLVLFRYLPLLFQEFVAGLALAPPTVEVDEALLKQYKDEMEDAANQPLPDEDDPDL